VQLFIQLDDLGSGCGDNDARRTLLQHALRKKRYF